MATSLNPPTTARGFVSDSYFGSVLDDLVEDLPADLTYPLSIRTYTAMAREPRIAAVLAGYELQLRRAQWQVDGRGCRPEVVQLVADGLGLPIAGKDEATGARTRGVSWSEHLRAALLSLRYGHYGFHLHAEVVDGVAKLIGLYDRPPWTINEIHADPKTGAFKGVTQDYVVRANGAPQIRAEHLAWYVHERVGTGWFGTSLLKSAWPAWVVKREILKTHGTAVRRWSAGVPVMEALPGTTPTPTQMADAMQLAAAARAGEQAGAATPPGFAMKILGISGTLPDALAFLEFLNREIASTALMSHLDLATGSTGGSRALGTAFIDSWTLALESCGESVADTATRQIAARITAWNYGDSEPVPRVAVSGVGSRREVTAESLDLLLRSGALSSDPGLEEWVRREYRLPERAEPAKAPQVEPAAKATTKPRARTRRAARQPALFAAADDPVPDAAQIQADWDAAVDDVLAAWPDTAAPMVDDLVGQVEAAVAADDLGALGTLTVAAGIVAALAVLLGDRGAELAGTSAGRVGDEAADQGVTITVPAAAGAERARTVAEATAGLIAAGYATGAGRAALQVTGEDASPAVVGEVVRAHLNDLSTAGTTGWVGTNVGGAMSAAQNAGRTAAIEVSDPQPAMWRAVEVNDKACCGPCGDVDGREYTTWEAAVADYPSKGYAACLGADRCRGFVFPLWR